MLMWLNPATPFRLYAASPTCKDSSCVGDEVLVKGRRQRKEQQTRGRECTDIKTSQYNTFKIQQSWAVEEIHWQKGKGKNAHRMEGEDWDGWTWTEMWFVLRGPRPPQSMRSRDHKKFLICELWQSRLPHHKCWFVWFTKPINIKLRNEMKLGLVGNIGRGISRDWGHRE